MQNSQEGTAVNTFEFTNKGNYNLCFGVPDPEEQTLLCFLSRQCVFFPILIIPRISSKIKQEGL